MNRTITDRLGIDFLCEIGASPVALAKLAAGVGCRNISIMAEQLAYNPLGYPAWSLTDDPALRRELKGVLADLGVSIALGEGLVLRPETHLPDLQKVIDTFCELGVPLANGVSLDPDRGRTTDGLARLAEMTDAAGIDLTIEFAGRSFGTLDNAVALIRQINRPSVTLLIDVLHVVRAGVRLDDLAGLDPAMIGYVQICDGPLGGATNYMDESLNRRMIPGTGEMPVREIMRLMPDNVIVSAEVPQLDLARSGVPASERLKAIFDATVDLMTAL